MSTLFQTVFIVSITTSLVILPLKSCSHRINRQYAVRWKYGIWMLLAFRLLIPWNPTLPIHTVTLDMPDAMTVQLIPPAAQQTQTEFLTTTEPLRTDTAFPVISADTSSTASPSVLDVLAFVWVLGIVLFLMHQLVGYLRFRRNLLRWEKAIPNSTLRLLSSEASRLGISSPTLIISANAPSPMVIGLLQPTLILPDENFSEASLTLILRHELTHLKRRDLWYKLLILLSNAVHWFNPVVYCMAEEAGNDLEVSCDHLVVQTLDAEDRKLYSETILESLRQSQQRVSPLSTCFRGGTAAVKERFLEIFRTQRRKKGLFAFCIVLICIVLAGGLVSCQRENTIHTVFVPGMDDANAITLSAELPEGWSFRRNNTAYEILNENDEAIGSAAFDTFWWYPKAESYVAIYNSLMLGSMANWNNEYTPVRTTQFTETAICRPWYKVPEEGKSMAEIKEKYYRGILSYDTRLLCYVYLSFEEESITDEQLHNIAESITLNAAGKQKEDSYTFDEALTSLEAELTRNDFVQAGLLTDDRQMLSWYTDQMYVTKLGNSRALFVTFEHASLSGNHPIFDEYAVCLDGKGFYYRVDDMMVQISGDKRYQSTMGKWVAVKTLLTPEQALEQLELSIYLDEQMLCFQIPVLYSHAEQWEIQIAGSSETNTNVKFLEPVSNWISGNRYGFPIDGTITRLTMSVHLGNASHEIDLMPYLQGGVADHVTVKSLAQDLSEAWLTTWYAIDGPKSGQTEGTPKAHPISLDLNRDGQKEIGILYNGNLLYSSDTSIIAFYQLTNEEFEEYAVLQGAPWLYEDVDESFDVFDGDGKTVLYTVREEEQDNAVRHHGCYYIFENQTLTTIFLPWDEKVDGSSVYYDSAACDNIVTEEQYNTLTDELLKDTQQTTIYHLYYERMGSELFTGEEPGPYLSELLEDLLSETL